MTSARNKGCSFSLVNIIVLNRNIRKLQQVDGLPVCCFGRSFTCCSTPQGYRDGEAIQDCSPDHEGRGRNKYEYVLSCFHVVNFEVIASKRQRKDVLSSMCQALSFPNLCQKEGNKSSAASLWRSANKPTPAMRVLVNINNLRKQTLQFRHNALHRCNAIGYHG